MHLVEQGMVAQVDMTKPTPVCLVRSKLISQEKLPMRNHMMRLSLAAGCVAFCGWLAIHGLARGAEGEPKALQSAVAELATQTLPEAMATRETRVCTKGRDAVCKDNRTYKQCHDGACSVLCENGIYCKAADKTVCIKDDRGNYECALPKKQ
jgi:hypothetical protein